MRLVLMHLHDVIDDGPEEEAGLVFPNGSKTVIAVPIEALDQVVPVLGQAFEGEPSQRCARCDGALAIPGPWDGWVDPDDPRA